MVAFIDVHQDVWSRYSGGSGAPAWTLEAIGFDLHTLEESGSAWLQGVKGGGHVEAERGVWPCGYQKLAAATLAYVGFLRFHRRCDAQLNIQDLFLGG